MLPVAKAIVISGFSLAIAGIAIVLFLGGSLLAAIYWPFYSYDHLNAFATETQKSYLFEVRFGSDSSLKTEQDNSALMAEKFYCASKDINQHTTLKGLSPQPDDVSVNSKQLL
jgi:hypothetical protein